MRLNFGFQINDFFFEARQLSRDKSTSTILELISNLEKRTKIYCEITFILEPLKKKNQINFSKSEIITFAHKLMKDGPNTGSTCNPNDKPPYFHDKWWIFN